MAVMPVDTRAPSAFAIDFDGWRVDASRGATLHFESSTRPALTLRTVITGDEARAESYVDRDGGLERRFLVRGAEIVEHLAALDATRVEQTWTVARRPAGDGDLEIRIELPGGQITQDGAGARLQTADGSTTYRCSGATWIDHSGRQTPISLIPTEEGFRWLVPATLIATSDYPAVLDPTIQPTFDLSVPTPSTAYGDQIAPRASFNGERHVVVWADGNFATTSPDVWISTVEPDGTLGSPTGSLLTADPAFTTEVSIAFDGTDHLVVFEGSSGARGIWVDRAGTPIGAAFDIWSGIEISDIRLAHDGTVFLLVFSQRRGSTRDVMSLRLGADGRPLDASPTVLEDDAQQQRYPDVAGVPGHFLVTWRTDLRFGGFADRAARVSATSGTLEEAPWTISADTQDLSRAAVGTIAGDFIIAWTPRIVGSAVVVQRLRVDGSWVDASPLSVSPGSRNARYPSVSCGVESCWVGHLTEPLSAAPLIVFHRLAITGSTISVAERAEYPAWTSSRSATSASATGALTLWDPIGSADRDVFGARMDATGLLDPTPLIISGGAPQQRTPEVIWNGSRFLVTWLEGPPRAESRLAARVDRDGNVLDAPFDAFPGEVPVGAFAHDGDFYLLGTRPSASDPGATELLAQRVTDDGTLRGAPFLLPTQAGGDRGYGESYGSGFILALSAGFRRYASDGTALDEAIIPTVTTIDSYAASRSQLLFASSRYLSSSGTYATRVGFDGTVLDTTPITIERGADVHYSSTASDGIDFALAWTRGTSPRQLRFARVTSTGTILDPSPGVLVATSLSNSFPRMDFDGTRYMIVFTRGAGVALASVSRSGAAEGDLGMLAERGTDPALASSDDGTTLVVWQEAAEELPYRNHRIRAAVVRSVSTLGNACTSTSDCDGAPCVDGVCCETLCGGGSATDCMSCSIAAGGTDDGRCTAAVAGGRCRDSAGECDLPEFCDGTSTACPLDAFADRSVVCRPILGTCDIADVCSGTTPTCPIDVSMIDGTPCGGPTCADARCMEGACTTGALACDDGNACTLDECAEPAGCVSTLRPGCCLTDAMCDDGDSCSTDVCRDFICEHVSSCSDAGASDAGFDAGEPDVGTDAPTAVDAWTESPDAGVPAPAPACGCRVRGQRGDSPLTILALLVLSTRLFRRGPRTHAR